VVPMRSAWPSLALGLAALLVGTSPLGAQPSRAEDSSLPHVRPEGERAAYTVARGLEKSPTLRGLVDRLQQSDVIVYVAIAPPLGAGTAGGIQFIGASTVFRYVRVVLSLELTTPQMMTTLGHELQHAVEVSEVSWVRDRGSFVRYYRQTGLHRFQSRAFDTKAAQEASERVLQELAVRGWQ
jgi:hypothetical protein